MREMYYLRDFQSLEAMLPLTKQRLRDAQASISGEDFRVFWYATVWHQVMCDQSFLLDLAVPKERAPVKARQYETI